MSCRYAVIEFTDEKSVGVVPSTWIESSAEALWSYWPSSGATDKVKCCELPDKQNWDQYQVRVFRYTDTYRKAVRKAKKAEETSNLDSDDDLLDQYVISDGENGDDEDFENTGRTPKQKLKPATLPAQPRIQNQFEIIPKTVPTKSVPGHGTAQGRIEARSTATNTASSRSQNPGPSTIRAVSGLSKYNGSKFGVDRDSGLQRAREQPRQVTKMPAQEQNENFQVGVYTRLDIIIENQKEQMSLIRQLLAANRGPTEDLDDILPSPMETQPQMEQLSKKVGEDPDFKKKLTFYLNSMGGTTIADSTRRVLKRLGTNRVWSLFSLKGQKGKIALNTLPILRVIIKAVLTNKAKGTVVDVEDVIGEYLKQAPHRRGGLKFKEKPAARSRSLGTTLMDSDESDV